MSEAGGADEILAWLDEKPSLSRYVGAARKLDQLQADRPDLFSHLQVFVVRNFTIEPVEPLLKVAAARRGLHLTVAYSGYDPSADEIAADVATHRPDVAFVTVRVEELASALAQDFLATDGAAVGELARATVDHVLSLAEAARTSGAAVFVHNFVVPLQAAAGLADTQDAGGQINTVRQMNLAMVDEMRPIDGVHIFDIDHLFAQLGLRDCYDERGGRNGDAPLSQAALRVLADAQARHIRALKGPVAKVVVVDCDNTLWGGVIGEDGMAGIALGETGEGRKFRDFQQNLLDLRRRGAVLALCTKNEEADVLEVFRNHPESVLQESDFAARRINWDDKAENIASIAKELGLGLEHMVFIDDNPVECEWVKVRLPAVRVIQWPGDLGDGSFEDLALFDSLVVTDEDRARTEMYQAESMRRTARDEVANLDDYLRSLNMEVSVGLARPEHLARLAQLTQRTNQFNLTTRRYDVGAMQ